MRPRAREAGSAYLAVQPHGSSPTPADRDRGRAAGFASRSSGRENPYAGIDTSRTVALVVALVGDGIDRRWSPEASPARQQPASARPAATARSASRQDRRGQDEVAGSSARPATAARSPARSCRCEFVEARTARSSSAASLQGVVHNADGATRTFDVDAHPAGQVDRRHAGRPPGRVPPRRARATSCTWSSARSTSTCSACRCTSTGWCSTSWRSRAPATCSATCCARSPACSTAVGLLAIPTCSAGCHQADGCSTGILRASGSACLVRPWLISGAAPLGLSASAPSAPVSRDRWAGRSRVRQPPAVDAAGVAASPGQSADFGVSR